MGSLITVGLPTFNRLDYLQEAVRSASAQTYEPIEILISQDPEEGGLHPGIRDWSESMSRRDSRIRYRFNERRAGLAGNWNALADHARGEYVMIPGDDDRLLPGCVADLAAAGAGADVVFSNHFVINADGRRLTEQTAGWTAAYGRDRLTAGRVPSPEQWAWRNAIPMSTSLIRRSDLTRLRFKEDMNTPEMEFFIRLAQEGGQFVFVPDYWVEVRVHARSATTAGLTVDVLADHLLLITVGPESEPSKAACLSQVLPNAVTRCLLRGDTEKARGFLINPYYSLNGGNSWRRRMQRFCTAMPAVFGVPLFRLAYRMRHGRWMAA